MTFHRSPLAARLHGFRVLLILLAALMFGVLAPARAQAQADPVVVRSAIDSAPLARGATARIGIKIVVDSAYHVQSATPHDEFLSPTTIALTPAPGITAGATRFPVAEEIKSPGAGAGDQPTLSVYQGVVYAQVPITIGADAPLGATTLEVVVNMQACDANSCLPPETHTLKVPVTIAAAGTAVAPNDAAFFAAADKQPYAKSAAPATKPAAPAAATMPAAAVPSIPPTASAAGTQVPLLTPDQQVSVINQRPYKAYNAAEHNYSLGWIILFALLGGAILNIMPCVLPVIPLKVLSLVQQAHGNRRVAVLHALSFSAGVIALFVALALVLKIFGLFYGQQFQSPAFLIVMVMFVIALALSMLGVWTINPPRAVYDVNTTGTGHVASFTNGLMATLLATPCSAPYLGPVLAWALIQPTWITALALGLVGVGMSLPYLILAAFPAGLNKLPRAGRWSELLKQGLGIVMIAVAVYLLTLVPNVTMWPWILLGIVVLGLTCWGWGQIPSPTMETATVWTIRGVVLAIGIGMGVGIYGLAKRTVVEQPVAATSGTAVLPNTPTDAWLPFNTALLDAALKDGRPVVVDWTADWCINCRSLEAFVLSTDAVQEGFKKQHAVLLRADLSRDNPPASRLNEKLGGHAIPVLAIFSPERPTDPVVLRDGYTPGRVLSELENAH